MYAMLDPEIELVGIVTSYGNVTKDQATANAAYLVQLAGRNDIPIIPGASNPVHQKEMMFYPEIHGEEGIGPIRPPSNMQYQIYPFDTIRIIIEKYRNELIIVDTGRSTTLATAFILFPDEINRVNSFYVMGGAFFVPGNVTALAEANFYGDPTSSNYVLKFAHNLTITPLNVTQFAIITPDIVDTISKNEKNVYASMMAPVFEYYYEFYKKSVPGILGAPIHDLLTIILVKNPTIVDYIYYDANVVEGIEARGQSYIDLRPTSKPGKTGIATTLYYEAFIEEFSKVMLPE
ncbi:nucleoside hydrolase [Halobacillus naozhouensis]|uniref:Nucleoside hydrolase n=2 Tax=Halobacillus naozhouensis TaxID=554880 RepID=A0ABY8J186_9BACI|nr:nucleoside hydrolase [Halobacillus naozhouensis]WFT75327.1 nucleoside hydrolase [Halobacillus naozhouensis]